MGLTDGGRFWVLGCEDSGLEAKCGDTDELGIKNNKIWIPLTHTTPRLLPPPRRAASHKTPKVPEVLKAPQPLKPPLPAKPSKRDNSSLNPDSTKL